MKKPDDKSLLDFARQAESIEDLAAGILDKKPGTKTVRELLQEAASYRHANQEDEVILKEDDQVLEEVLPAYENLRPYSSDDVVFLMTDSSNRLIDVRHVKESDAPADQMMSHLVKKTVNRHAFGYILVLPEDLKDHHSEFARTLDDFCRNSRGGFLGKECLSRLVIDQNSDKYIQYACGIQNGRVVSEHTRKGETWTPPHFFTAKEEAAIRDYHFEKLMGKRIVPNRKTQSFTERSKETDDAFYHITEGMRWLGREEIYFITLDEKHRVNGVYQNASGTLDCSVVDGNAITEQLLSPEVASGIFVHNHPSGGATPSTDDCQSNRRLRDFARHLGKPVYSILVAEDTCTDFTHGSTYDTTKFVRFQPKPKTGAGRSIAK